MRDRHLWFVAIAGVLLIGTIGTIATMDVMRYRVSMKEPAPEITAAVHEGRFPSGYYIGYFEHEDDDLRTVLPSTWFPGYASYSEAWTAASRIRSHGAIDPKIYHASRGVLREVEETFRKGG